MGSETYSIIDRLERQLKDANKQIADLCADNMKLHNKIWDLTLALLEKPVPKECPPSQFPDISFAITEPPPEHPDGHDEHVIIAAISLDEGLHPNANLRDFYRRGKESLCH